MTNQIVLGPLLGFEQGDYYTVCILTEKSTASPVLRVSGKSKPVSFEKKATVGNRDFWRAEFKIAIPKGATGTHIAYQVQSQNGTLADRHGRTQWTFYVPGDKEQPKIAYGSCNGFSSSKLVRDTNQSYALWQKMAETHHGKPATKEKPKVEAEPFSLLLMGGDQVYADEIWESKKCPTLKKWGDLSWKEQHVKNVTTKMTEEIAGFYDELYIERWEDKDMSLMFASIPSVMMWDDHDIFDGWGSYPDERQNCPVFHAVFKEAARVFDVFQLRCGQRNRLNAGSAHRTLGLRFRDYHILVLDNRSERTQSRIMSEINWIDTKKWLANLPKPTKATAKPVPNLLVMTGVPVVY